MVLFGPPQPSARPALICADHSRLQTGAAHEADQTDVCLISAELGESGSMGRMADRRDAFPSATENVPGQAGPAGLPADTRSVTALMFWDCLSTRFRPWEIRFAPFAWRFERLSLTGA